MNAHPGARRSGARRLARIGLLMLSAVFAAIRPVDAATNVVIWDARTRLGDTVDGWAKAGWKVVPTDLLALESDPSKAASDPGYYGREYSFTGDAVVENRCFTAAFCSARGRVVIQCKLNAAGSGSRAQDKVHVDGKRFEFAPISTSNPPATISRCVIVRNAGDEAVVEAFFSAGGSLEVSARFTFGKTEIVEIQPSSSMKGVTLRGPIAYGVVPGFIGDDLIFGAGEQDPAVPLCIPAENMFLGLLRGEESMLVMTWPKGRQQLKLNAGKDPEGRRLIESLDFDTDRQSFYVAAVEAPGIWHREALKPSFLEKDQQIEWKRPFPARWRTQLDEAGVKTTFTFRETKGEIWRGVPGSYKYPVWFSGPDAFFHLSKKVPPQGESLIYFLEGQDTPVSVSTPVDILKATLGRQASDSILDVAGRKLRTHHRRGADGVRRACTCGCTDAIQAVFTAGEEATRKEDVAAALEDMIYFVEHHVGRIDEYRRFADELTRFLEAKAAPDLKAYVEGLQEIVRQIPQEYSVQKENMGSPESARQLTRQTLALASRKDPNNLKAYMELLKAWRAMGGAQDYVLAQCHRITRKLCQEAGYRCLDQPQAALLAQEIRARCRQILRNPDGYEIWADY